MAHGVLGVFANALRGKKGRAVFACRKDGAALRALVFRSPVPEPSPLR